MKILELTFYIRTKKYIITKIKNSKQGLTVDFITSVISRSTSIYEVISWLKALFFSFFAILIILLYTGHYESYIVECLDFVILF